VPNGEVAHRVTNKYNTHVLVLHRDIRASTILVNAELQAKIVDFSYMCGEESRLEVRTHNTKSGTVSLSPEMARNQMYNASADVYAFGILLFEVITELPPSRTFRYRVTNAGFTLLEDELRGAVKPGCPAALEALAFSCCETKPAKRPDAAQCVEELDFIILSLNKKKDDMPGAVQQEETSPLQAARNAPLKNKYAHLLLPSPPSWKGSFKSPSSTEKGSVSPTSPGGKSGTPGLSRTLSAERGALADVAEVDEEGSSSDESDPGVDLLAEFEHRLQHSHGSHEEASSDTGARQDLPGTGAALTRPPHAHAQSVVNAMHTSAEPKASAAAEAPPALTTGAPPAPAATSATPAPSKATPAPAPRSSLAGSLFPTAISASIAAPRAAPAAVVTPQRPAPAAPPLPAAASTTTSVRSLFGEVAGPSPSARASSNPSAAPGLGQRSAGRPVVPLLPPPPAPSPRGARATVNLERRAAARMNSSGSPVTPVSPDSAAPGLPASDSVESPPPDNEQAEDGQATSAVVDVVIADDHSAPELKVRRQPVTVDTQDGPTPLSPDGALELIRDIRDIVTTALALSPPPSPKRLSPLAVKSLQEPHMALEVPAGSSPVTVNAPAQLASQPSTQVDDAETPTPAAEHGALSAHSLLGAQETVASGPGGAVEEQVVLSAPTAVTDIPAHVETTVQPIAAAAVWHGDSDHVLEALVDSADEAETASEGGDEAAVSDSFARAAATQSAAADAAGVVQNTDQARHALSRSVHTRVVANAAVETKPTAAMEYPSTTNFSDGAHAVSRSVRAHDTDLAGSASLPVTGTGAPEGKPAPSAVHAREVPAPLPVQLQAVAGAGGGGSAQPYAVESIAVPMDAGLQRPRKDKAIKGAVFAGLVDSKTSLQEKAAPVVSQNEPLPRLTQRTTPEVLAPALAVGLPLSSAPHRQEQGPVAMELPVLSPVVQERQSAVTADTPSPADGKKRSRGKRNKQQREALGSNTVAPLVLETPDQPARMTEQVADAPNSAATSAVPTPHLRQVVLGAEVSVSSVVTPVTADADTKPEAAQYSSGSPNGAKKTSPSTQRRRARREKARTAAAAFASAADRAAAAINFTSSRDEAPTFDSGPVQVVMSDNGDDVTPQNSMVEVVAQPALSAAPATEPSASVPAEQQAHLLPSPHQLSAELAPVMSAEQPPLTLFAEATAATAPRSAAPATTVTFSDADAQISSTGRKSISVVVPQRWVLML
jgi:hypothetical protein